MPFLGNTPANTFVSIAKQTITGNGGTSYSLSYAVTSANDIDVFYNNVRQEPGVAYTANGTTITFSEAIQSTDSVYVIFNGQAVGTIDAPAGAYLPTTGGTINGSVGVKVNADSGTPLLIGRVDSGNEGGEIGLCRSTDNAKTWAIDVYGNTSTPSLRIIDNIAGAVRLGIDGSGRVTTPKQPMFYAQHNNTVANGNGNYGLFDVEFVNVGNCVSHSTFGGAYTYTRFTCPVAGVYWVWVGNIGNSTNTTSRTYIYKNGANAGAQLRTNQTTNHGTSASMNVLVNAAAGDWIAALSSSDDNTLGFYSNQYSHFGVVLYG